MATRVDAALAAKLGPLHLDLIDARAQVANARRLVEDDSKRTVDANCI